ncbi:MAG: MBL fold metallo-hydrolase [Acidobacteria bacterium]|nr:MBL fold metallo-hydrolase [Acidobacteriota bacterium]
MSLRTPVASLVSLVLVLGAIDAFRVAGAQERAANAQGVETIQIRPNMFVIFGAGANITVHTGPEGVVLVDSGSMARAGEARAAVRAISAQPVRLIVNTSADPDHVGGNETLARGGLSIVPNAFNAGTSQAAIVAHENVLLRMSAPTGRAAAFPLGAWPTETYTSRTKSMYFNDDGIQVIREVGAHSDGDSVVFFRRTDVVATGDILDLRQFPVIDAALGGSIQGEIDSLNRLLELAIPAMPLIDKEDRTLLVPGHGRISDHADLVEYRDMVTIIRDTIQRLVDKGMTLQQVKAADPAQGYRARFGRDSGPWTTDMFVEAVFRGLRRSAS